MAANRFAQKGFDVTGIGRKKMLPAHVDKRCKYLREDITRPISEIDADIVIHAAAQVDDAATYKDHYITNVTGTWNVIQACKNVKIFLLVSTSSVYPFSSSLAYKENEAGNEFEKLSHYGRTKFLAEKELLGATNIPHKVILRPRAIYGVGDSVLLPRLLKLVKKNYILLPAHTTEKISLTNIDNLLDAMENCLLSGKLKSGIYNIADDKYYSLKKAIPLLLQSVLNRKFKILFIPVILWKLLVRVNTVFHVIPHLTKFGSKQLTTEALLEIEFAKKEIKYSPKKDFNESVKEIGEWYGTKK